VPERIDHAAEAARFAAWADNPTLPPENVTAIASMAQVHATLALVEQQRIANMLRLSDQMTADEDYLAASRLNRRIREGLGL